MIIEIEMEYLRSFLNMHPEDNDFSSGVGHYLYASKCNPVEIGLKKEMLADIFIRMMERGLK